MLRSHFFIGALLAMVGLYVVSRTQRGQVAAVDALGFVAVTAKRLTSWEPPASAAPYLPAIRAAESDKGLPHNLLARMAYQESRFREDIISGRTQSAAGAVGILQIVPRWHPDVDATNPFESIEYAAGFVRSLFNRYKSWTLALAAYNAGAGNVDKYGGIPPFQETQNYVREIAGDVGLA